MEKIEFNLGDKQMTIETGRLAKQSNGSVVVSLGDARVLVTVNSAKPRQGIDFFPLTVDYVEKSYAAGRIPGGFFKREGRLSEKEILTSRFIDRSLRPLFPAGYQDETQVTATVLSADQSFDTDILGFIGASAAVNLADIPFPGPIGAVRVARVNGELIVNPSFEQREKSTLQLVVAGKRDAIVMVEGGAKDASEADVLEALRFAHQAIQPMLDAQEELMRRVGKVKRQPSVATPDESLRAKVKELALERIREATQILDKKERNTSFDQIKSEVMEKLLSEERNQPREFRSLADVEEAQTSLRRVSAEIRDTISEIRGQVMRNRILDGQPRIDGRAAADIRPITCEVGAFPGPHGSSIFTRGETQAYVSVTLGGGRDEQLIEGLQDTYYRGFYLHYNFPPFSVGEVRPLRGPGRREIGHGSLAERAIRAVLPTGEDCLYTIRVVSEILESNGSSSMATVCGASLALMDAGIQTRAPVAGIAMGLISEGDRFAILSDILGDEDHLGDMDFKVAGTREGIAAIQMDIKIDGLEWSVLEQALEQARKGRLHILDCMERETASELTDFQPRSDVATNAPRVSILWIKPDRIRDIIGPGGRVIRAIQEATGAKLDVDDSGRITLFSPDKEAEERCKGMVEEITQEAEVGKLYMGKVKKVTDFGAFVEIFPGTEGLLHISELADRRVGKVEDICVEGDEVMVKCLDVDPSGKIRLSRRAALAEGARAAKN